MVDSRFPFMADVADAGSGENFTPTQTGEPAMDPEDFLTLSDDGTGVTTNYYTDPDTGIQYFYDENGQITSQDPNNPLYDPNYAGPAPDVVNPDFYVEGSTGNIYWLDDNGDRHYTGDIYPNTTNGQDIALGKAPASNLVSQATQQAAARANSTSNPGAPGSAGSIGLGGSQANKPNPTATTTAAQNAAALAAAAQQSTTKGVASLVLVAIIAYVLFDMTRKK